MPKTKAKKSATERRFDNWLFRMTRAKNSAVRMMLIFGAFFVAGVIAGYGLARL